MYVGMNDRTIIDLNSTVNDLKSLLDKDTFQKLYTIYYSIFQKYCRSLQNHLK